MTFINYKTETGNSALSAPNIKARPLLRSEDKIQRFSEKVYLKYLLKHAGVGVDKSNIRLHALCGLGPYSPTILTDVPSFVL